MSYVGSVPGGNTLSILDLGGEYNSSARRNSSPRDGESNEEHSHEIDLGPGIAVVPGVHQEEIQAPQADEGRVARYKNEIRRRVAYAKIRTCSIYNCFKVDKLATVFFAGLKVVAAGYTIGAAYFITSPTELDPEIVDYIGYGLYVVGGFICVNIIWDGVDYLLKVCATPAVGNWELAKIAETVVQESDEVTSDLVRALATSGKISNKIAAQVGSLYQQIDRYQEDAGKLRGKLDSTHQEIYGLKKELGVSKEIVKALKDQLEAFGSTMMEARKFSLEQMKHGANNIAAFQKNNVTLSENIKQVARESDHVKEIQDLVNQTLDVATTHLGAFEYALQKMEDFQLKATQIAHGLVKNEQEMQIAQEEVGFALDGMTKTKKEMESFVQQLNGYKDSLNAVIPLIKAILVAKGKIVEQFNKELPVEVEEIFKQAKAAHERFDAHAWNRLTRAVGMALKEWSSLPKITRDMSVLSQVYQRLDFRDSQSVKGFIDCVLHTVASWEKKNHNTNDWPIHHLAIRDAVNYYRTEETQETKNETVESGNSDQSFIE